MVALADTTHLPPLPPEDQHLLERYIHHNENLNLLAKELASLPLPEGRGGGGRGEGVESQATAPKSPNASPVHPLTCSPLHSPLSLLLWTAKPHIAPYITLYRNHITHLDKREAIELLKSLMRTVQDPTEKRRAATTLLRALANQLHPTKSRGQSEPSGASRRPLRNDDQDSIDTTDEETHESADAADLDDDEALDEDSDDSALSTQSSARPPPPSILDAYANKPGQIQTHQDCPIPCPEFTPQDIVAIALRAIQHPDTPCTDAGPTTLYNLMGFIDDRTPESLREFKNNALRYWVHEAWSFKSAGEPTPMTHSPYGVGTCIVPITLADGLTLNFRFEVHRPKDGTLAGCWILRHFICQFRAHAGSNTS